MLRDIKMAEVTSLLTIISKIISTKLVGLILCDQSMEMFMFTSSFIGRFGGIG